MSDLPCDITDEESVAALADFVRPSGIRVLAHVAGLAPSAQDVRLIMSVNLIGAHRVAEALLPLCVPRAAAIFVASVAAYMGSSDETIVTRCWTSPCKPAFWTGWSRPWGRNERTRSMGYRSTP